MSCNFQCISVAGCGAVYIVIPKVACTSIKTVLAKHLGISLETAGGDPHAVSWPAAPQKSSGSSVLFPGYFTFAFVRNPWDRLVSCYRDKVCGQVEGYSRFTVRPGIANCLARFSAFAPGMSFGEFVAAVASLDDEEADPHFRSQHTFVTNAEGKVAVDFVGRFERLAEDFRWLQERIGMPATVLPKLQAARTQARYADFYTPELRRIVAARFEKDIETFGYELGSRNVSGSETERGLSPVCPKTSAR